MTTQWWRHNSKERKNLKKRERLWDRMKNKNERKKKENKDRRERARCGPFISRLLQATASTPATIHFRGNRHSMEERLLASGQNRCAKLETGRTVGKAQIKNALPTWTQYTAALIPLWKPKTKQHYFMSQSTERLQFAQWQYRDSVQRQPLNVGKLWPSKCCPF